MKDKRLATIFAVVFVDLLGFSLILPLLPYYAEKYGATPAVVGLLVASYALAQLIGAPLLGRLSDRYGRRPVLLVSIAGTVLGFLLLGFAEPIAALFGGSNAAVLAVLFFSRILDGLTGGNLSVAQAYITDVTDVKNRAKALGLIGAAFGLGFIIGPVIGGVLSQWGYALPAFVAAGLATANLIAVYFFLPESLTDAMRLVIANKPRAALSARALWAALNRPRVGPLLHIRFFFGLASGMFQSIFALYALSKLGLDAKATGYVLGYVGLLVVLVQAGLIGRLTARWSEKQLIFASTILLTFSFVAWAFTPEPGRAADCADPAVGGHRRHEHGDQQRPLQVGLPRGGRRHARPVGIAGELLPRDRAHPGRPAAGPGRSVGAGHPERADHGLADLVHLPAPDRQPRPAAAGARRAAVGRGDGVARARRKDHRNPTRTWPHPQTQPKACCAGRPFVLGLA